MPAGKHALSCTRNGKDAKLTVNVSEKEAALFQAELAKLMASGGPKPFIGFDHQSGSRAFVPLEFRWQAGAEAGVYVRAQWTRQGKAAVTAEEGDSADYGYFSPTFLATEAGEITGLPASGEIGSLVNNPAFRQIAAVAASEPSPSNAMTDAEIAALQAENNKLKAAEATAQAELKKQKEAVAASLVSQAVNDGKIAAQDTATQDFWKASLFDKPDSKAVLDALPVRFAVKAKDIGGTEAGSSEQDRPVNGNVIRARANDILTAARASGRCMSWNQAWNSACAEADLLPSSEAVTAAA